MQEAVKLSLLKAMNSILNVRSYLERPIPQEIQEELFYAFSLGPSVANTQPWELIAIEDPELKGKVADATLDPFLSDKSHGGQSWILNVPSKISV